ncbi:hypothetical protein ALC57_08178 [Trachymyrmex cornetzi]|uniref:Nuclease HARBI1 n=1 Tax=Trachymyrmex cornetzi TaxID=471704 RepID=A0A151J793_9HYME|nr:hypothetical protein ALC57_08178 [Trachymyrmex cornetzi]
MDELNFSNDEEEEEWLIRAPKRYLRDYQNPFEFYSEWEFKRRFRFSKNSIMFGILPLVEEGLAKINNRGLPISPVLQLLICLRFYSTASFQVWDIITISQSTISRIVFRVSTLLASYINKYIKMPSSQQSRFENKRLFKELGCDNCTTALMFTECIPVLLMKNTIRKYYISYKRAYTKQKLPHILISFPLNLGDNKEEWRGYGRFDSKLTGIRKKANNCEPHAPFRSGKGDPYTFSEYGSTSRRDALTPVPIIFSTLPTVNLIATSSCFGVIPLSRARRTSENGFGVYSARFQIFRSSMRYDPDIATLITQCCCALYNFLRSQKIGRLLYTPESMLNTEDVYSGVVRPGEWREESVGGMANFIHQEGNRHSNAAIRLRDEWCAYFDSTGAVPWQEKMIK